MTTRKEFRDFLLHLAERGVERVYVYRFPDGFGGFQHKVTLEEVGDDFTYCQFHGDLGEVYKHCMDVFVDHYEVFHEDPQDVQVSLWELVLRFFIC